MDNDEKDEERRGYPNFQYSTRTRGDSMLVIRQNDYGAFEEALGKYGIDIKKELEGASVPERKTDTGRSDSAVSGEPDPEINQVTRVCSKCGWPATERKGVSKTGKAYHAIFCSSDDKTHTVWL